MLLLGFTKASLPVWDYGFSHLPPLWPQLSPLLLHLLFLNVVLLVSPFSDVFASRLQTGSC